MRFSLSDQISDEITRQIEAGLVAHNAHFGHAPNRRELLISVEDEASQLKAGLWGFTHWGWLYVKQLWVSEAARGTGLGSRLLRMAEEEALRRGCHGAYLDTFSFQALAFYEKQGYASFGLLEDFPQGEQRIFLKKILTLK